MVDPARHTAFQVRQTVDCAPVVQRQGNLSVVEVAPVPTRQGGRIVVRQILVDGEGRLTAVIDWGDMHVGDPALDLSVVYSFFPARARAALLAEYGPVDEATMRLARFRAIFHSAIVLIYGHDIADKGLEQEGRTALDHCLDAGT